ncbi:MAG: hprK [Gemmatimonadetes bacterium]|nr:hprK [Gemmatimonadota bacterium]
MSKALPLRVGELFARLRDLLELEQVAGTDGLSRVVTAADISSPGLALAGFVARFPAERIQVFGETEVTYLRSLDPATRREHLRIFFAFPFPCLFVTKSLELPEEVIEEANKAGVSVLRSPLKTNEFYARAKPWLEDTFAPQTTMHGSLADVYGVGLLLIGQSGIGKSECVLDLVERGHRLVADDMVLVKKRGSDILIGRGPELQKHYMEIRGIGLVDIPSIFGIRAVRQQKRIEVVVQLLEWQKGAEAERTGLDEETTEILGVSIPRITILLNPGKNITVVAEVIAMHHLLKWSGIDPAARFNEALIKQMRDKAEIQRYLREDHE